MAKHPISPILTAELRLASRFRAPYADLEYGDGLATEPLLDVLPAGGGVNEVFSRRLALVALLLLRFRSILHFRCFNWMDRE